MTADLRLARCNREITAERCGWPGSALAVCEMLDAQHPGWTVTWMGENRISGWERPAGFAAHRSDWRMPRADELRRLPEDGVARHPFVFGPTVAELEERIAAADARRAAWLAAESERHERWVERYRAWPAPLV